MEISVNTRQVGYSFAATGTKKSDGIDFADVLANQANVKGENKLPPEKWVTDEGYSADSVKAAAKFMRDELGIDVSKIEPTHEITAEQMEWLMSRHDFSTMRQTVMYSFKNDAGQTQYGFKSTPEYSNFLGDLMYLGIYSEQELTVDLWVEPIDTRPNSYGGVISEHLSDYMGGSALDFSRAVASDLDNMWNFYSERSKSAFVVEGDAEFAELIKEQYFLLQNRFLELLDKCFKGGERDIPQNIVSPQIEDASAKIAEEFSMYTM